MANLVPLHMLTSGDKFRLPGKEFVAEIGWQSPNIVNYPAGHAMVEKVEDDE